MACGGGLLGIIEAKKVTVSPQTVLEQAKRYAASVFAPAGEWDGLRVPFLYASNATLVTKPFAGSVKTLGPATLAHLKTPAATGGAITCKSISNESPHWGFGDLTQMKHRCL